MRSMFAGEFEFDIVAKLGDNHKADVRPRSCLIDDCLTRRGTEVSDPYPDTCLIFNLTFHEKELVDKDKRSKKLTWFLNQCQGRDGYSGVAAIQVLAKLEQDGIVERVKEHGPLITIRRVKWPVDA